MPRRVGQKKTSTENVKEPSVKDALEIHEKNITELFRRWDMPKHAVSESCGLYTTTSDVVHRVPNLSLTIDATDKPKSIRVFLRQKTEEVAGQISGGGIELYTNSVPLATPGGLGATIPAFRANFLVARNLETVHVVTLGSDLIATVPNFEWDIFYPPNAIDFTDFEFEPGILEYAIYAAIYTATAPGRILMNDLELVAQKFY